MNTNCTECGRDTKPNIHLCKPCQNDPDYADYRTEWEIWDQKMYEEHCRELISDLVADEQREYWDGFMLDQLKEGM